MPDRRTGQADTTDIAALIAATDRDGRVDPLAFEAQRLILQSQRLGAADADALVRDLPSSPAFQTFGQDALLEAIDKRLETPAEQRRFAEALDVANLTDGVIERQWERAGEAISDAYGSAKSGVEWSDKYLTDKMSWSYQRAGEVANNPDATPLQREAAELARDTVGKAQELYGESSGGVVHSLNTLKGFVDLGEMGYRFTTDENYRDLLIGTAKLYAAETVDDPGKPVRDLRNAATQALEHWEKDYKQAKAGGRERQFLGEIEGAVGVELAATLVPVTKLAKFGKLASSLERAGAEGLGEAAELAGDANRALRRAEAGAAGEAMGDAAQTAARSARAAEAAEDVLRAEIRLFRDEGKLDQLIEAAHRTGNAEGLLRSGELSAKELTEVLKRDASIFGGKVGFEEALDISTKGVNLAELTTKQLGDIGEAIHTHDLVKAGHTDIVAIKNASGHGIDVVSRDPAGKLQFDEVKTSAIGQAKAQRGDPEDFVLSRLDRAIEKSGHWKPENTMPGMGETATQIRREIFDSETEQIKPGLNAKWVQMNLSRTLGASKLEIEKTVEDWIKPEPKKHSLLESISPDHQALHQRIVEKAKEKGLDDERADNLAAQGLMAFKQDRLTKRADDIGIYGDRLFITYFPYGHGRDPNHHVNLDVNTASQKPAQDTLQQVAQLDRQQEQERLAQQQTQQQDGPDGPKGPTIGPRTV